MFDKAGDWVETNFMPVEHVSLPTDFPLGAHLGGLVLEPFSLMSCNGVFALFVLLLATLYAHFGFSCGPQYDM